MTTRAEFEAKIAQNPRFKVVRELGKGFTLVAGSAGAHLVEPKLDESAKTSR